MSARVGRTSLLLVPLALASRGAAFLVPLAVAAWFGVDPITDAWFWALALPTFALVLAGSALGTTATPAIAALRASAPERLPGVLGALMLWSALAAAGAALLICLVAPAYLERLSSFAPETRRLATLFLWELLPFAAVTTAATVLRVACEVYGRFQAVTFTPLLRAAVVLAVTWAGLEPLGPHALAVGLIAGEIAQMAWWGALLAALGVRPKLTLRLDPAVRQVGRDVAPILGGEMLVALNLVVDKGFAALLPEGAVATLEYADRARVIPQTLLQSTLAMVAFAAWSNLWAAGRLAEARAAVDGSLRWTAALSAPVLAGMFIGRTPLIQLLYERGAFTPADTAATASVLAWFLPGVLPGLLGILAVRAHIIERNLRLILWLGVASVVGNATLNALLVKTMGLEGLALGTTIVTALVALLYIAALRGAIPFDARRWRAAGAIVAASVGIAAAVELGPGAPQALLDPVLWAAAALCLALLGLGTRLGGPPRP